MKKSEMMGKLIEIEKDKEKEEGATTISMNYVNYLEMQKRLVEQGDVELE